MLVIKIIAFLVHVVTEYARPVLGYTIIGVALIALAVVFPWVLILYAVGIGGALISDR